MGGSSSWMRKIKALNLFFYSNLAVSIALPLSSLWAMVHLSLGKVATWSAVMAFDPLILFGVWSVTNVINCIFFYLQNYNRLVKAVWFEPDSYSVCVELHNWFQMWNVEKNFFQKNDDAKVIKLPFKFLSPDKYGPEKAGSFYQFDFAHVSWLLFIPFT